MLISLLSLENYALFCSFSSVLTFCVLSVEALDFFSVTELSSVFFGKGGRTERASVSESFFQLLLFPSSDFISITELA